MMWKRVNSWWDCSHICFYFYVTYFASTTLLFVPSLSEFFSSSCQSARDSHQSREGLYYRSNTQVRKIPLAIQHDFKRDVR